MEGLTTDREIADSSLNISADPFLKTTAYQNFLEYRRLRQAVSDGKTIDPDSLVIANPNYYHAYVLAGNYMYGRHEYAKALNYYQSAITKVVATKKELNDIESQIAKCKKHLSS